MGQRNDLVDALLLQLLDGGGGGRHVVADQDVRTGGREFRRVVGDGADDADLLAADLEHDRRLDAVADLRLVARQHVGGDDREGDLVEEAGKAILALVEFMVADGHRVELHQVQELGFGQTLIGGEEQRALEVVAGVEQQHVLAGEFLAFLLDQGLQAGDAAEALVLAFLFRRAGRIELVDRLDAGMEVVDMQDVQLIIGEGSARGEGKNGRGHQAGPHVSDHDVLLFCRLSADRFRSRRDGTVPHGRSGFAGPDVFIT